MTLLTWSFEPTLHLSGCGVDSERVDRFANLVDQNDPFELVFSAREISHIRTLSNQAEGFCMAFCCKEAICKALERPFDFRDCELLLDPAESEQTLCLSQNLRDEFNIAGASARIMRPHKTECLAIVYLWSDTEKQRSQAITTGRRS